MNTSIATPSVPARAPLGRGRRSSDRALVALFESADRGDWKLLRGMSEATEAWTSQLGHDTSGWPREFEPILFGERAERLWLDTDINGEVHRLALLEFATFDLLVGVSSRRQRNASGGSGNVAMNRMLSLLEGADPSRPDLVRYGVLVAAVPSRILRAGVPGTHLLETCRDWDIVIRTRDLSWDPATDRQGIGAILALAQSEESSREFVRNVTHNRQMAHERGIAKMPRAVTTPAVFVHPETGAMSWDHDVCEVLAEAVALKREGLSWKEVADLVADRIPSYTLRDEPDIRPSDAKPTVRTRTERNARAAAEGRPQVALKHTVDGRPNPLYRPETLADTINPDFSLRSLFLLGSQPPPRDRARVAQEVDTMLGGHPPEDTVLTLLSTGVYRRLVVDTEASNSRRTMYRYISFDLGPYSGDPTNPGFPLCAEDVHFMQGLRQHADAFPSVANAAAGLFKPAQREDLYTSHATVSAVGGDQIEVVPHSGPMTSDRTVPGPGRLIFTTGKGPNAGHYYKVVVVPAGQRRGDKGGLVVARMPSTDLHCLIVQATTRAIDLDAATTPFATAGDRSTSRRIALKAAGAEVTQAAALVEATSDALAAPGLSDTSVAAIVARLNAATDTHAAAITRLAAVEEAQHVGAYTDHVKLDTLIDLLALLSAEDLDADILKKVRARLLSTFVDGQIEVLPSTQEIELRWTVVIPGQTGAAVHIPVVARMANQTKDTWQGGVCGLMWARRISLHSAMALRDKRSKAVAAIGLKAHLTWRLSQLPQAEWRGLNAIRLLVRCPHDAVVAAAMAVAHGEAAADPTDLEAAVRDVFFGRGPDLPGSNSCNWNASSPKARPLAPVLAAMQEP